MYIIPEFDNNQTGNNRIETYRGRIKTLKDALLVLEGSRLGILPQIKRRLNGIERRFIRPNTIFAWNETECGMKRWTDGKNWSASKVAGPFLVYKELDQDKKEIKRNGLLKQSFSLTTKQGSKLHLISYYINDEDTDPALEEELKDLGPTELPRKVAGKFNEDKFSACQPINDPLLKDLTLDSHIYQEYLLYYDQYSNNHADSSEDSPTHPVTNIANAFPPLPELPSRAGFGPHKVNSYPQSTQQIQQIQQFQHQMSSIHHSHLSHFQVSPTVQQPNINKSRSFTVPQSQVPSLQGPPRTSLVPPILYQPLLYPPPPTMPKSSVSTPASSQSSYFQPTPNETQTGSGSISSHSPSYSISTGYYNYSAQHPPPQYYHPPSGQAILAGIYHYALEAPRMYSSTSSHGVPLPTNPLKSPNASASSSPNQSTPAPKREDSETIKMLDKTFSSK